MVHTHGRSKASVDLQYGQFIEVLGIECFWELVIWNDLVCSRRLNTFPISD